MTDAAASSPGHHESAKKGARALAVLFGLALLLALAVLGLVSPFALISTAFDVIPVCVLLAPPVLLGTALMHPLGLGALPMRWRLLFGAALGLGMTSLAVLIFGSLGWLGRGFWVAVIFVETGAGIALQRRQLRARGNGVDLAAECTHPGDRKSYRFLWLFVLPFAVMALLAASNAPGLIWSEEGFGYDVLEYHLQLPKEYRQLGRIEYLPHNVYANFPASVEMLYLLDMVLQDDDIGTGSSANIVHLALAALAVYGAWVVGSRWSQACGVVAGVTLATTGWLVYLSGLAYVENGLLFFGIAATGAVLLAIPTKERADPSEAGPSPRRLLLIAGLLAGFACGCKYTAVPMIALPLAVASLLVSGRSASARAANVMIFSLGAAISFAPWLVKNVVYTGNPVFPLANSYFEAAPAGWGPEEPAESERGLPARVAALWRNVPADHYQRFGPGLLLLALGGMIRRRRDRSDATLGIMLSVQLLFWLFATHLFSRFAVVFLVPLALMAGRSLLAISRVRVVIGLVILAVGAGWNFVFAAHLVRAEGALGAPASIIYDGQIAAYDYFKLINHETADDAKILLVGEARAFYFRRDVDYQVVFNRNPFVEAVRHTSSDEAIVDWLRAQGYTHVLVNWLEIERLRGSYGFASEIDLALFDRLGRHRLFPLRHYRRPGGTKLHVSVYRVSPA